MPRIVGKYAGIIIRNILRTSFILGDVSQLFWKGENNSFTIPGKDTVQFCVYTVFTYLLHSRRVSLTHSLSLSLTHTHTHTHTKQRQQQQRGINHFFSDRMKVMMPVFFCLLVRGHHFACHVAMVNICRLYKNVFPCACVCLCVCVYVCVRARASKHHCRFS